MCRFHTLGQHLLLPGIGVGVERIAHLPADAVALVGRQFGVVLGLLVGAQRVQHGGDGRGAVIQRNAGVFGLRLVNDALHLVGLGAQKA